MKRLYTLASPVRLLALLMTGAALAQATPVVTDLNPDLVLSQPGQTIPIDVDQNGTVDFNLFYDVYNNEPFLHINVPTALQATNKVVVTGEQNAFGKDEIFPLGEGFLISSGGTYNGPIAGNGPLLAQPSFAGDDIFEGLGTQYVGLRFARGGQTHYGWMRVNVNQAGTEVQVDAIAYEQGPGTAIRTPEGATVPVSQITVTGLSGMTSISVPGGSLQMTAQILPANATNQNVTWSVDDTSKASISPTGLLTARKNGNVTVTATAMDGSGVSGTAAIAISGQTIPVSQIIVRGISDLTTITMPGGSLQMFAQVLPNDATNTNVTWSVNDTATASISPTGLLTARKNGIVMVTATAMDGSGVSGTSTITITGQPTTGVREEAVAGIGIVLSHDASFLTIELPEGAATPDRITLHDITGRVVAEQRVGQRRLTIDCSSLPNGLYLIAGTGEGARFTQRVMIAR